MHPDGPRGIHSPVPVAPLGPMPAIASGRGLQIPLPHFNLTEQMAHMQDWQHHADAQFSNFNNMMQQQQTNLQAYFHF
uniref:Uncharacterized protein n=1 Tax=Leersia perrieri TaxID=77586 RepID=A0A0D9WQA9_9ORYZ